MGKKDGKAAEGQKSIMNNNAKLVPKEILSDLKKTIHRGEKITFDYVCINGKTIVGRTTSPIDIQWHGLTLFGIDESGKENAYKIRYMLNIQIQRKPEDFISDQYDPSRSLLKNKNEKFPSKYTGHFQQNTIPQKS